MRFQPASHPRQLCPGAAWLLIWSAEGRGAAPTHIDIPQPLHIPRHDRKVRYPGLKSPVPPINHSTRVAQAPRPHPRPRVSHLPFLPRQARDALAFQPERIRREAPSRGNGTAPYRRALRRRRPPALAPPALTLAARPLLDIVGGPVRCRWGGGSGLYLEVLPLCFVCWLLSDVSR